MPISRNIKIHLLLFNIAVFLIAYPVFAQITTLTITREDSGAPAENLSVEVVDEFDFLWSVGITDFAGVMTFPPLLPGSYVVKLLPQDSSSLTDNGLFLPQEFPLQIDSLGNPNLTSFELKLAPKRFKVIVSDAHTLVGIQNVTIDAVRLDDYSFYSSTTNADGVAFFPLSTNDYSQYEFSSIGPSLSAQTVTKYPSEEEETIITLGAAIADATIEFTLQEADGSTFSVPTSVVNGSITCQEINSFEVFTHFLAPFDTSAAVSISSGEYDCVASIGTRTSTSVRVRVSENESVPEILSFALENSQIRVFLVDEFGMPIVLPESSEAVLTCESQDITQNLVSYKQSLSDGATGGVVTVPEGNYECGVTGKGISSTRGFAEPTTFESATLDLFLSVSSSAISLSLSEIDGITPFLVQPGNPVTITCIESTFFETYTTVVRDGNHSASLSIPAGHYECSADAPGVTSAEVENVLVLPQGTASLNLRLEMLRSIIEARIIDADTSTLKTVPLSVSYAEMWCIGEEDDQYFSVELSPGDLDATLITSPGSYLCGVSFGQETSEMVEVEVKDNQTVSISIPIKEKRSKIIIDLIDSETGTPYTVHEDDFPYISCESLQDSSISGKAVFPGDTSVTINVTPGIYRCEAILAQKASKPTRVSVKDDETVKTTISLVEKNSKVTLRIVDTNGTVITGLNTQFSVWSSNSSDQTATLSDFAFLETSTGTASFSLVDSTDYETSIWVSKADSQLFAKKPGGERFIIPQEIQQFRSSNTPTTIDFVLRKSTSSIKVTVKDGSGKIIKKGFVQAYSESDTSTTELWTGEEIDPSGVTILPVIPNRQYRLSAFPEFNDSTTEFLPSTEMIVSTEEGKNSDITLVIERPNHSVTVTTRILSIQSELPSEYLSCYAYNSNGQQSFSESTDLQGTTLQLLAAQTLRKWKIGCFGVKRVGDIEKIFQGQADYTPEGSSGKVEITLSEENQFFPLETYSFDATKRITITLSDGVTTVTIPEKAIAASGTVTMTAESGKGYTVSDSEYPFLTYDIKFKSSGRLVSNTVKPVKISFPIDQEFLTQKGVTSSSVFASSFNNTTKNWQRDGIFSYDPTNGKVTVSATHFSIWGILVDIAKKLKSTAPVELKSVAIKNKKKKKRKKRKRGKKKKSRKTKKMLSWEAPTDTLIDNFEVQVVKVNKKKKRKRKKNKIVDEWRNAKTYTTVDSNIEINCLRGTRYMFRVRPSGGIYSKVKKFKG